LQRLVLDRRQKSINVDGPNSQPSTLIPVNSNDDGLWR